MRWQEMLDECPRERPTDESTRTEPRTIFIEIVANDLGS